MSFLNSQKSACFVTDPLKFYAYLTFMDRKMHLGKFALIAALSLGSVEAMSERELLGLPVPVSELMRDKSVSAEEKLVRLGAEIATLRAEYSKLAKVMEVEKAKVDRAKANRNDNRSNRPYYSELHKIYIKTLKEAKVHNSKFKGIKKTLSKYLAYQEKCNAEIAKRSVVAESGK